VAYPSLNALAIAEKLMDPANPPFPTPWNFPFQVVVGNHNSISMCESVEGFKTAATLQYSGNSMEGDEERPGIFEAG
jgi:hypothetical protein